MRGEGAEREATVATAESEAAEEERGAERGAEERSRSKEREREKRRKERSRSREQQRERSRSRERGAQKRDAKPKPNQEGFALLRMQRSDEMLRYAEENVAFFDEFACTVFFSHLPKRLGREAQGEQRRIVQQICSKMEDRISSFKEGRTLSTLIYGLCKLDVDPSDRFLKLWSEQCVSVMGTFNPQNLSNTAYGLAKLGFGPKKLCENFFFKWSEACVARFSDFKSQELSNCVYALGKLKLERRELF